MACLKMAGAPAAQVSKVASARGFKDNNDHKDIKDAREGTSCALAQSAGDKGRARYGTHGI